MVHSLKLLVAKILGSGLVFYHNQIPRRRSRLSAESRLVASSTCALIRFGLSESPERRMIVRSLRPCDRVSDLVSIIGGIAWAIHSVVGASGCVGVVEARSELMSPALHNVRQKFSAARSVPLAAAIDCRGPFHATNRMADFGTNIVGGSRQQSRQLRCRVQ